MTDRIYCVSSALSLGCTFLDWSLLYLSGQQEFFNVRESSFVAVSRDPLLLDNSTPNAHGHKKNCPSGKVQAIEYANILKEKSDGCNIFSMYLLPLHFDLCCKNLGISISNLSQSNKLKLIRKHQKNDYLDMLDSISLGSDIPVIYVWYDRKFLGYHWQYRSADRKLTSAEKPESIQDQINEQQEIFFGSSQTAWKNQGLTESWDTRERMALDLRPFDPHWSQDLIPSSGIDISVHCFDLWSDTESVITDIMSKLNIGIKSDMVGSWRPIAEKWQAVQHKNMEFSNRLSEILDSIINDKDYTLPDLSLYQEAIVQHCLIYQHDLNFKTWGLEKFPANARDLHRLLEPNIHHINA
jgi:hypothetical protein